MVSGDFLPGRDWVVEATVGTLLVLSVAVSGPLPSMLLKGQEQADTEAPPGERSALRCPWGASSSSPARLGFSPDADLGSRLCGGSSHAGGGRREAACYPGPCQLSPCLHLTSVISPQAGPHTEGQDGSERGPVLPVSI